MIAIRFGKNAVKKSSRKFGIMFDQKQQKLHFLNRNSNESHFSSRTIRKKVQELEPDSFEFLSNWSFCRFSHKWRQIFNSISWRCFFKMELQGLRTLLSRFFEILSLVCLYGFKSSSDPSHFIFEINVGKGWIRQRTTLK